MLANHWLDDSAAGDGPAHLLSLLGGRFDLVLQSCRSGHMVPEPAMFRCALKHLGVTSQQVSGAYAKVMTLYKILSSAGFLF